jgi:uncharacterized protein YecT (DUF1311 family)
LFLQLQGANRVSDYRTVELQRFVVAFWFALSLELIFPGVTRSAALTESDHDWAAQNCATSARLGQQEKALCSAYEYQQADAKLNALYKQLKTLSAPGAWKLQVEEERVWVKERDDNCIEDSAKDKGSQDPQTSINTNGCLTLLTNKRVKLFEERIAALSQLPRQSQDQPTFAGGWDVWMCPAGVARDPEKCANFSIFLYEKAGQLCGAHIFATANASRLDEGGAPSIIGKSSGLEATVIAESSRSDPPVRLHVRMGLEKNRLHWEVISAEPSEGGSGEYLIPADVWLTRTLEPVFSDEFAAELKTACESPSPAFPTT